MNLPDDIKQRYGEIAGGTPLAACRALTDPDGNMGETYVLLSEDKLVLIGRPPLGRWQARVMALAGIADMGIELDSPFAYLNVAGTDGAARLKFSSMDADKLEEVTAQWQARAAAEPPPAPGKETPMLVFAAALHALTQVDGEADAEELEILTRMTGAKICRQAAAWLAAQGVEAVFAACGRFSREQRLCLLANLLEVAMADGLLRTSERGMVERFKTELGVTEDEYNTLYEVLLLKNNMTVFDA